METFSSFGIWEVWCESHCLKSHRSMFAKRSEGLHHSPAWLCMNVASFAALGGIAMLVVHMVKRSSFSEMNKPDRPSHLFLYSELNCLFTMRRDVCGFVAAIQLDGRCISQLSS